MITTISKRSLYRRGNRRESDTNVHTKMVPIFYPKEKIALSDPVTNFVINNLNNLTYSLHMCTGEKG